MRTVAARRLAGAVLVVVLAAGGVAAIVAVLSSRDSSTFGATAGPGRLLPDEGDSHLAPRAHDTVYATKPPASGPHVPTAVTRDGGPLTDDQLLTALEQGNVVLVHADAHLTAPLRALADATAGPFDPAIAQAGQAVILDRERQPGSAPIIALSWRHELTSASPSDPSLRSFIGYWLGRGAPGAKH